MIARAAGPPIFDMPLLRLPSRQGQGAHFIVAAVEVSHAVYCRILCSKGCHRPYPPAHRRPTACHTTAILRNRLPWKIRGGIFGAARRPWILSNAMVWSPARTSW